MSYNSGSNRARNFKSASRFALVRFWNYSRDYSLNCTPLGPITHLSWLNLRCGLGNGELGTNNLLNVKMIFQSGTSLNEKSCKLRTVENEESICPALRLKRQSKTQRYYFFMVHIQFKVYTYLRPVVDTKRNRSHCYRVSSDEIPAKIDFLQSV